jgi:hypothetical protein
MIISLVSIVIGLGTIAVGLYVLSITPAPEPVAEGAQDPFIVVPQVQPQQPAGLNDVPSAPVVRGSEPWCEQLMNTPDDRWSDADSRLFAQNCLYP